PHTTHYPHFPYTTLFRSGEVRPRTCATARIRPAGLSDTDMPIGHDVAPASEQAMLESLKKLVADLTGETRQAERFAENDYRVRSDRKSTRLNSSHVSISY